MLFDFSITTHFVAGSGPKDNRPTASVLGNRKGSQMVENHASAVQKFLIWRTLGNPT